MNDNMIIVFEAIDAGGKATQSKLCAERLGATRFSFPNYESVTGQLLRAHLKQEWVAHWEDNPTNHCLNARLFQTLQTVNRIELIPDIAAAQKKGSIVFDRYWASALIYGGIDGLEREWLLRTQRDPLPAADLWILLDIPVEESFKRRPEGRDRYEADGELLKKVRAGYLKLWGEQRGNVHKGACLAAVLDRAWQTLREGARAKLTRRFACACDVKAWEIVDGIGTVEEVQARVNAVVDKYRGL